jgi:hypothetical protein
MFGLFLAVRDEKSLSLLVTRCILKSANRLLLESFLETRNGFIDRITCTEKQQHAQSTLTLFQVEKLEL